MAWKQGGHYPGAAVDFATDLKHRYSCNLFIASVALILASSNLLSVSLTPSAQGAKPFPCPQACRGLVAK